MEKLALSIPEYGEIEGAEGMPNNGIASLSDILRVGIEFSFIIAIILCLAFIIWGGIDWILAGGNKESLNKARQKLVWAVLGLMVVFLSFFVINVIANFFGIEFFIVSRGWLGRSSSGTF